MAYSVNGVDNSPLPRVLDVAAPEPTGPHYTPQNASTRSKTVGSSDENNRKLFLALQKKHPHYVEWEETWTIYRDVVGDNEPNKEDYLPKGAKEPQEDYDFRVKIAHWTPETPRAINRITSALYQQKPKRELKNKLLEKVFIDDCDMEGTSFDNFMARVMRQLLDYGMTRVLVNQMPRGVATGPMGGNGEQVYTREDRNRDRLRPYVVLYNPLNVIDWDVDEHGGLNMIRIKEIRYRKNDPTDPFSEQEKVTRFIHYDRQKTTWWDFSGVEGKEVLMAEETSVHGLGRVPMVVRYWPEKMKPMIGQAYIRYMAKWDMAKFQAESDREYATFLHSHPLLLVWTDEQNPARVMGSGTFWHLKPGGAGGEAKEDAKYMGAPLDSFDALDNNIDKKLAAIYRHSNADPMGVVQQERAGVFETSGVSRAWSFATSEALLLSDLADAAVDIEVDILNLVTMWEEGPDAKWMGEVQYPEEFDLSSTAQLISELQQIMMMVNSPKLIRLSQKRIAASKVGDVSATVLKQIQVEIDKNPLIGTMAGMTKSPIEGMPLMDIEGQMQMAMAAETADATAQNDSSEDGGSSGSSDSESESTGSATSGQESKGASTSNGERRKNRRQSNRQRS
jgi:hypothetical protein